MFTLKEEFFNGMTDGQRRFWESWSGGYTLIPNELLVALMTDRISTSELAILTYLFSLDKFDTKQRTSKIQLSRYLKLSRNTVAKAIDRLLSEKLISVNKVEISGVEYSEFSLNIKIEVSISPAPCSKLSVPLLKSEHTPAQNCSPPLLKNEHPPCSKVSTIELNSLEVKDRTKIIEHTYVNKSISESFNDGEEEKKTPNRGKKSDDPLIIEISSFWNEQCGNNSSGIAKVTTMTPKRSAGIRKLTETHFKTIGEWKTLISKVFASDFLRGQIKGNWKASFDWVIKEDNAIKIMEGNYDNRSPYKTVTQINEKGEVSTVPILEDPMDRIFGKRKEPVKENNNKPNLGPLSLISNRKR